MKLVQYIGNKSTKTDNIARTGLVWSQGQVHPVTDEAAQKLLAYPTVWIEATHEKDQQAEAPPVLRLRPRKAA